MLLVGGFVALGIGASVVYVRRLSRRQDELRRRIAQDEWFQPAVAGKFRDGRRQSHPWLRVLAAGHDRTSGERYYMVQVGGSGADWSKASEIDLHPDEPTP
jgi:hypothetical protein